MLPTVTGLPQSPQVHSAGSSPSTFSATRCSILTRWRDAWHVSGVVAAKVVESCLWWHAPVASNGQRIPHVDRRNPVQVHRASCNVGDGRLWHTRRRNCSGWGRGRDAFRYWSCLAGDVCEVSGVTSIGKEWLGSLQAWHESFCNGDIHNARLWACNNTHVNKLDTCT